MNDHSISVLQGALYKAEADLKLARASVEMLQQQVDDLKPTIKKLKEMMSPRAIRDERAL